jgi:hypothetical protein
MLSLLHQPNRHQIMTRSCSYCKQPGHTINSCFHPSINIWYEQIKLTYNSTLNYVMFASMVSGIGVTKIRAVSVRYTGTPASRPQEEHIAAIYQHFQLSHAVTLNTRVRDPAILEQHNAIIDSILTST